MVKRKGPRQRWPRFKTLQRQWEEFEAANKKRRQDLAAAAKTQGSSSHAAVEGERAGSCENDDFDNGLGDMAGDDEETGDEEEEEENGSDHDFWGSDRESDADDEHDENAFAWNASWTNFQQARKQEEKRNHPKRDSRHEKQRDVCISNWKRNVADAAFVEAFIAQSVPSGKCVFQFDGCGGEATCHCPQCGPPGAVRFCLACCVRLHENMPFHPWVWWSNDEMCYLPASEATTFLPVRPDEVFPFVRPTRVHNPCTVCESEEKADHSVQRFCFIGPKGLYLRAAGHELHQMCLAFTDSCACACAHTYAQVWPTSSSQNTASICRQTKF